MCNHHAAYTHTDIRSNAYENATISFCKSLTDSYNIKFPPASCIDQALYSTTASSLVRRAFFVLWAEVHVSSSRVRNDAWVDGDRIGCVNGRGRVYATPLAAYSLAPLQPGTASPFPGAVPELFNAAKVWGHITKHYKIPCDGIQKKFLIATQLI